MDLNPVERSLLGLCNHCEKFRTDTSKRLLVWRVQDNAVRMLQCFFEVQKHESELSTNDLFIVFDSPFENSIQYSRGLKEALAGQYEASREDLKQEGILAAWQFDPPNLPDSATGFLQGLRSFASKYHDIVGHIAAVFMPQIVTDDNAFSSWLLRALDTELPEYLRLLVVDSIETPRLSPLTESGHKLAYIDDPAVDALAVAQQTFAEEGGVGPAAVFRNFLMGLLALVEKGTVDQVKTKAADTLAFARKQGWADQEVVVTMLVAGAFLKEKRFDEAVKAYQSARQSASKAASNGHPAGQQLILQTWFGEAGAHLAAGDDALAAECYDQAAIVAQKIPNPILAIEASRMGTFCNARLNNRDGAIERGSIALTLGERLKPEERAMTTLPIAAIDLLRVVEPERVKMMEDIKHRQDAQIDASRTSAERRAATLEHTSDVKQLRAVEKSLMVEAAEAQQKATHHLEALVAAGGGPFRQIFARARDLLGGQWPLADSVAIPRAPDMTEGAAP